MWWHDIKDIKDVLCNYISRVAVLERKMDIILQKQEDEEGYNHFSDRLSGIEESLEDWRKEIPRFEKLVNPEDTVAAYQKHITKLDEMMLEFKGCVSIA